MKKEDLDLLVKNERIRIRSVDKEKIKSLLESSKITAEVVLSIPLNEKTATVIFREAYESIRQLGDAQWWLLGCEPLDHGISLDVLKGIEVKESTKLNFLDRFRRIRNDANYRGFKISMNQAQEIINFWNEVGMEILEILRKKVK